MLLSFLPLLLPPYRLVHCIERINQQSFAHRILFGHVRTGEAVEQAKLGVEHRIA